MLLHLIVNALLLTETEPSGAHRLDASGLSNQNSPNADGSCKYFMALQIQLYPDGQPVRNPSQFLTCHDLVFPGVRERKAVCRVRGMATMPVSPGGIISCALV